MGAIKDPLGHTHGRSDTILASKRRLLTPAVDMRFRSEQQCARLRPRVGTSDSIERTTSSCLQRDVREASTQRALCLSLTRIKAGSDKREHKAPRPVDWLHIGSPARLSLHHHDPGRGLRSGKLPSPLSDCGSPMEPARAVAQNRRACTGSLGRKCSMLSRERNVLPDNTLGPKRRARSAGVPCADSNSNTRPARLKHRRDRRKTPLPLGNGSRRRAYPGK